MENGLVLLNTRLVRRLMQQMEDIYQRDAAAASGGASSAQDSERDELTRNLIVAFRICCEMGQAHLAGELYGRFREASVTPMTSALAAELIGSIYMRYQYQFTLAPPDLISEVRLNSRPSRIAPPDWSL